MRLLAFIRAMKWKGLIVTAIVTAILGLVLTLYSCKPGSVKEEESVKVEKVDATLPGSGKDAKKDEEVCTPTSCELK
ncbi:hypothetical protein [Polluticoccus soli]|uniref:hypothetical protein n=1 Tax=Polluticoccus soli TaxID=3034150 RepID=UPI0023E21F23|nr:hypothetical protein [Flavipsychrobacter sp. JY13-12]